MGALSRKEREDMVNKWDRNSQEDLRKYRKEPGYFGYEDYTPSGRAAMKSYRKDAETANDYTSKGARSGTYSKSAAKKAQQVQRDTMNELKRETRHTVDEVKLKSGGMVRGCGIARKGHGKGTMR